MVTAAAAAADSGVGDGVGGRIEEKQKEARRREKKKEAVCVCVCTQLEPIGEPGKWENVDRRDLNAPLLFFGRVTTTEKEPG